MLRELEVAEPMLGNAAYRALCERLGFVPVSAKPKAEAMTALASVLKGRAAQLKAEEKAKVKDWKYKYEKSWAVNPNLPLELEDGTPVIRVITVERGDEIYVEHGRTTQLPGGVATHSGEWIYELDTGLWSGAEEGERWKLRNVVAKPAAIDWDLPIEFIDGTPAIVPEDYNTLKHEGTYRVEVVAGHAPPAALAGKLGSSYGGWWFNKSGMLDENRYKDAGVVIRNRAAKPAAIDWDKPIEFIDGTPAILPLLKNGLKHEGTYRVEAAIGRKTPAALAGKRGSHHGGWWFHKSGMLLNGRFKNEGVLIRNRAAKSIDWDRP